mmetsp:Transcript_20910/g.30111  ORF Transcript_20910/g.30111 Transcript_20910/m.30111 type:complete len:805 (-) Transcript_20910:214-2628(-)|eukprot:CAMPEP_0185019976 /NCGR_PEP_ID=MMETSP1103-20130426/2573_1 /TAXON_ID=36769 /ORGANISM="Paraphysomonas bandaiensis, Strain Caron Lab Isolate" /LENGTH=804 /DNA_ID=CAMNT_0027550591 /DNA_START=140 /DNA_END=2554 /DNA_ORIENTATION=+
MQTKKTDKHTVESTTTDINTPNKSDKAEAKNNSVANGNKSNEDHEGSSKPKYNRPRSNTCPTFSPTQSRRLKLGSKVIILGTENVELRVPQYVGVEAEIVDVPVHPATWYKVQFADGAIVTFRPSALRLASECTNMETSDFHVAANRARDSEADARAMRAPKPAANRPRSNSAGSCGDSANSNLLSTIDPDRWPTCQVRIMSGRLAGHVATVRCSGNGWVQLDTPYGEVAKRASELELVEVGTHPLDADLQGTGTIGQAAGCSGNAFHGSRRRANSESVVPSPTARGNFSSSRKDPRNASDMTRLHLVDSKTMALQQEYIRKYIEKQRSKIKHRPDLKYWAQQMRGDMVDPNFERDVSRDLRTNFCSTCCMEKWPAAKFCWNELCPSSPVFWRLPGGAGNAEGPAERYRAVQSLLDQQHLDDLSADIAATAAMRCAQATTTGHRNISTKPSDRDEALQPEEELACSVLGAMGRVQQHTTAAPNVITEFINSVPAVELGSARSHPSSNPSRSQTPTCGIHTAQPVPKEETAKNNRSDSSTTDCEDVSDWAVPGASPKHRGIGWTKKQAASQMLTLGIGKSKSVSSGKSQQQQQSRPPLLRVDSLSSDDSAHASAPASKNSGAVRFGYVETSRPSSTSSTTSEVSGQRPHKRVRRSISPFSPSPKGGIFLAQGPPPSQEEFARLVSEHHFQSPSSRQHQQRKPPSPQCQQQMGSQQGAPLTIPLSVLTARVAAAHKNNSPGDAVNKPGMVPDRELPSLEALGNTSSSNSRKNMSPALVLPTAEGGASTAPLLTSSSVPTDTSSYFH